MNKLSSHGGQKKRKKRKNSSIYRGNLNSLPPVATLRITSLSYIALFHAYWDVFTFWVILSWLTRSCPTIDCVLFRKRWYFSTLFPLLLTLARGQNFIWRDLHISSKVPLNHLSGYNTKTSTMPNDKTTTSIKNLAGYSDLVYIVIDDTMDFFKSNAALSRWRIYLFLFSAVPGDHMSKWIILNGMVTVQGKKYCLLVLQTLYDTQFAQPFTNCLTYSLNLLQNNSSRIV